MWFVLLGVCFLVLRELLVFAGPFPAAFSFSFAFIFILSYFVLFSTCTDAVWSVTTEQSSEKVFTTTFGRRFDLGFSASQTPLSLTLLLCAACALARVRVVFAKRDDWHICMT